MIGKKQLEINAEQFVLGMTTTDYTSDGGFGNSTVNINPLLTPGVMRPMASETDASTNVVGNMVASSEDSQAVSSYDRLFVDDGANFYTLSSNVLTKRSTGAKTYTAGTTDMVSFCGNTYASSTTDIAQWNTSTLTLTESWWVTTKSQSSLGSSNRHPLLVFENLLWIADGNKLHTVDNGLTVATNVLTLNSNELIVALGIDPITGLMLISVTTVLNYSDALNAKNILYVYDGYSSKPRRKIYTDDLITAFYNIGGQVFVGYGLRLGYWNGNGITFLRALENVTLTGSDLPYKHHFTNIGNTLLVINGANILAYGELTQGGRKVFYYPYKQGSGTHLNLIANVGNVNVYIAKVSGNTVTYINLYSTSGPGGSSTFYTNRINFQRPVTIQMIRVITTGITTTGGIGGCVFFDEKGVQHTPAVSNFVVSAASSPKYVFDFQFGAAIVQMLQARIVFESQGWGVVRIIVYYDQYE